MPKRIPSDVWLRARIPALLELIPVGGEPPASAFEARPWSWIKLAVLDDYLPHYLKILHPIYRRIVFVDLFAGSGISRFDLHGQVMCAPGSSAVAASYRQRQPPGFHEILAVEAKPERLQSVGRVLQRWGYVDGGDLTLLEGDCNSYVDEIASFLRPGGTHALLFADPEGLDLHFETIRRLIRAHPATDLFITHLVSGAARVSQSSERMDAFYDGSDWQGLQSRKELSELYVRKLRTLRDFVHPLEVQSDFNGYQYDLVFAIRKTKSGSGSESSTDDSSISGWRKRVSALAPKVEHLTGKHVEDILSTLVSTSIRGKAGHQTELQVE